MAKISALPPIDPATIDGSEMLPTVKDGATWGASLRALVQPTLDAAAQLRDQAADLVNSQNVFVDVPLATAEAGLSEGTYFKIIDSAAKTASVYERTAAGSTELYKETTTAGLAAPEGAEKIGAADGFNLQEEVNFLKGPVYHAQRSGVVPSLVADNTAALQAALAIVHAIGGTLQLPRGWILSGDIGNWARRNITIAGAGMSDTILKFTHPGIALDADAFPIPAGQPGSATQPFIDQFNVRDLTIEGNANTTDIVRLQGISRSHWSRVNLREAGVSNSKGLHLMGVMTCVFVSCYVSTNYNAMTYRPFWGLYAEDGSRNGKSVGHTSQPVFINCEFNGLPIGMELHRCDHAKMMGGAAQNCTNTGLKVRSESRYNNFENVAFENPEASAFDVQIQGILTKLTNCYTVKELRIQGDQTSVEGGMHERIQIDSSADHPSVFNVWVNQWDTGNGGFVNTSSTLRYRSIFDVDAGKFIYPGQPRTGITVGASPFTWVNDTGLPVDVIMQSGAPSLVQGGQGGDLWLLPNATPGKYSVAAGHKIKFTFEDGKAPGLSYVPRGDC